jgi:cytochrome c peroxidase
MPNHSAREIRTMCFVHSPFTRRDHPIRRLGFAFACTLILSACLFDRGDVTEQSQVTDGEYVPVKPVTPPGWPAIVWPKENPYSPAKDVLGRRLFFDPRLSRTMDRACSWCHGALEAFADVHGDSMSVGVDQGVTTRNTPTLSNMAFARVFFHDGRASSLEEQALGPLYAPNEMDMNGPEILARLSADTAYERLFRQAFGEGAITMQNVTRALATYERTLISYRAPYDRWLSGDSSAISPAARRGAALFSSAKTGCATCHIPPLFTDGAFHNIGLDGIAVDPGRGTITGKAEDMGKFKTPTLRNIRVTHGYMHDARFKSLEAVLDHYNKGGVSTLNADPRIHPLGLTILERDDLIAFLDALSDSAFLATPEYRSPP